MITYTKGQTFYTSTHIYVYQLRYALYLNINSLFTASVEGCTWGGSESQGHAHLS